ncbi:MAG TPA: hypothetical protein VLA66_13230, partial [Thermoanaerobaculia bacterium]|nr:hypothetical protein [Thermoanaerobaculia bacterium]
MRAARSASVRVRLVAALALGAAGWPGPVPALDAGIELPGCSMDAELAAALIEPPQLGRECGTDAACWRDGLERAREVRDRFAAAYDAHRAYVLDVRAAAKVLGNEVIEEAAAEYRRRAEEHPDHPAYRHLLAQMASEGEDYRRELDALTREFPGYPWAHLSAAFQARGGFPEDLAARAEEGLERFVEICPERLVEIGRAVQFLGGADGAEERLATLRAEAVARGD